MIKILFPFLLLCLAWSSGNGQCESFYCESDIKLCRFGENIISDLDIESSYKLHLWDFNAGFFNTLFIDSDEEGNIKFSLNPSLGNAGIYQIECLGENLTYTCSGTFTIEECVDYLDFDACYGFGNHLCNPEYVSSINSFTWFRNVCLGDTSLIRVGALGANSGYMAEPFYPDRINCDLGSIINYTEDEFEILWTDVGTACIDLTTTSKFGSELLSGVNVDVLPVDPMVISSNKGDTKSATVCIGEDVKITLETENVIIPRWEVNGSIYYGYENIMSFDQPGEYTVSISHLESWGCNCTPDAFYTIIVNSGDSPSIDCKRTVCAGESTTYYSGTECDSYIWNVGSGGSILDGGGVGDSYVTVEWNSGPTDEISLSTPSCFETTCSDIIVETINIINPTINIEGPDLVCFRDVSSYLAPNYTGTNFEWVVSPEGKIIRGQGTNRITVRWNVENQSIYGKVSVTYENCNIGCDGYAEMDVSVLPKLTIEQSSENLCQSTDYSFSSNLGIAGDWTLIDPNEDQVTSSALDVFMLNLTLVGKYTLQLQNPFSTSCNEFAFYDFEIVEDILPVASIDGPQLICAGRQVKYTVPNLKGFETVSWEVIDGSGAPIDLGSSKSIFYTWMSAGPYQITVSIINTITGCESESSVFLFDNDVSLNGSSDFCLGEEVEYILPGYYGDVVIWNIDPSTAGTIIEANEEWVRIIWSELGVHHISAEYCGLTLDSDITVRPYPTADLEYDDLICFDELTALDIDTDVSNSIAVYDPNNALVSESANSTISSGMFNVEVESPFGCSISQEINIDETEEYEVKINTLMVKGVCPPFNPIEIFSVEVSSNYMYQWYKDDIPVGSNSSSYFADELGRYHLVVTDENGCRATSDDINIVLCCGSSPSNTDIPPIDMDVTEIDCNTRDFEILAPFQSTNFNWTFGDIFSGWNTASGISASHTFSRAGRYRVTAVGDGLCEVVEANNCGTIVNVTICERKTVFVDVPLVADFSFKINCESEPVAFVDETTKLSSIGSVMYEWDFGDPASPDNTSSDQTPSHVFSSPGTFIVTLSVSVENGCTSTKTKTVIIEEAPTVSINSESQYCIGVFSTFEGDAVGDNLTYTWDFGDPGSGNSNTSTGIETEHVFTNFGTFTVGLVVTDARGCTSSTTKMIDLIDNQMEGDISSDLSIPKCPEDTVSLSAPLVGDTYLWSTGETAPTIEVTEESEYRVTITNAIGCTYSPRPFQVFNYEFSEAQIYAIKDEVMIYDSINVCVGDEFSLYTTENGDVSYEWSPDYDNDSQLEYEEHFQSLVPGRYSYMLTITDIVYGCVSEDGPFIVNIYEEMEQPVIMSENGNFCENTPVTLSVNSFDPSLNYEWNNGLSGESITVYSSGKYEVTVTNEIGCSIISESFYVRPLPGTNEWMTGCLEVCFPNEFCLNLNEENDYELIHNGINTGSITNTLSTIDITAPGDYELLVTNQFGCQSKSDVLTLTASPKDQTLSGIVYLDENENLVFDNVDVLQGGVIIYLMNGNTIIDSMVTDDSGYYNFDPVSQSNLRVVLGLSTIEFSFEGVSDSTLIFNECLENKEVNFPLVSTCEFPMRIDTIYTCPGEPVLVNGSAYFANEADTIIWNLDAFCDSTYIFNVRPFEEPDVVLDISPSCSLSASGSLMINSLSGGDLEYSLTSDFAIIDSVYSGLDTGTFILYVRNEHACTYYYSFTIESIEEPEFSLSSVGTCHNFNEGELEIEIISGEDVLFSLHPDSVFTDKLFYSGLNDGTYQIFAQDSEGCIYSDEIEVESYAAPEINIVNEPICSGNENGIINIEVLLGNPQFSIDNSIDYSYETSWSSLSPGPHVLYFLSQYECLDSFEFNIDTIPAPSVDILTVQGCENLELGSANISSDNEDLMYSLDGIDFSDQSDYENLDAGAYILYTMSTEGCINEHSFDISQFDEPLVSFSVTNSCSNLSNGVIDITSQNSSDLLYSIDNVNYSKNLIFEDLKNDEYILYVRSTLTDCEYLYPFTIEEFPEPDIAIVGNNTCEGQNDGYIDIFILSGSSLSFDINQDGVFSEETHYENLTDGDYMIMVEDAEGCRYGFPVSIGISPVPDFSVSTVNSCDQIANGSLTILSDHNNLLTSINGSTFELMTSYPKLENGVYEVEILDSNQCSNLQYVEIFSNPPLETSFDEYSLDCYDTEVELTPAVASHYGELEYSWNTEESIETILVRESGTYEVTISDFCDEHYLSTDIEISLFDEENPFYAANIFSPNDDNINDCFQAAVDPTYDIISFELKIFDRWGNLFFETENVDDCWDGRHQYHDVVPGVYVYAVNMLIDHCDGAIEVSKLGDVTLVR